MNKKTHQMKLSLSPFTKIVNGEKIIESRLFDDKRKLIVVGDEIIFTSTEDLTQSIKTEVEAIYIYGSFQKMFSDFPPNYFGGESKEELLSEIEQFYSIKEQKQFGVIGIKIKKLGGKYTT